MVWFNYSGRCPLQCRITMCGVMLGIVVPVSLVCKLSRYCDRAKSLLKIEWRDS
ncbi:hypothetical protein BDR03DRAFT_972696 [Suillus americanus]|nr:hypothetical protein BDR03DRAFT_972696 [Suillus americanus]